jgi:hypothetical protein
MLRYANDSKIQRNAKISKYLTYGGLGLMVVSLILSFNQTDLYNLVFAIFLVAVVLTQVGIVMMNRWGRRPRIDEVLDSNLKGLNSSYAIFHYELGAKYVLSSPAGLFAVLPSLHEGKIEYEDGKWWQRQLRRGRERKKQLKNLPVDAELEVRSLQKALRKKLQREDFPPINALIVFLSTEAEVHAEDSSPPGVHIKKLKSYLRKLDRGPALSQMQVEQLAGSLRPS